MKISALLNTSPGFVTPLMRDLGGEVLNGTVNLTRLFATPGIVWVEWANELAIQVSQYAKTDKKRKAKLVVRLHSYEVFAEFLPQIEWDAVDLLIFVSPTVMGYALRNFPMVGRAKRIEVVYNPLNMDSPVYSSRARTGPIMWAGDLNYKKGPELFVQAVYALPGHTFHAIARDIDPRHEAYVMRALDGKGVKWHDRMEERELRALYRQCSYVLSTSPWESFQYMVADATVEGCVPLVHDWPGATVFYPVRNVWRSIEDLTKMVGRGLGNVEALEKLEKCERSVVLSSLRDVLEAVYDA